MPPDWDVISSPSTVYHNFNIKALGKKEPEDAQMYSYDVEEYTMDEYKALQVLRTRSDVDFIAVTLGVDLGV